MTLHDAKGGGFNQMFLELCFSVTLQDEAVPMKCSCSLAFVCRTTKLYDERQTCLTVVSEAVGERI